MTNIYMTPAKGQRKTTLRALALSALEDAGWKVEKAKGGSSVYLITKDGESQKATIRTTQDQWIAFPRDREDTKWVTLADADVVVAASVDDVDHPTKALIHMMPASDVRRRFDRNYAAKVAAGHSIPLGRGIWLSLYEVEDSAKLHFIGAGLGTDYPAFATLPLAPGALDVEDEEAQEEAESSKPAGDKPLTVDEAKRGLALQYGVSPDSVKIVIEW